MVLCAFARNVRPQISRNMLAVHKRFSRSILTLPIYTAPYTFTVYTNCVRMAYSSGPSETNSYWGGGGGGGAEKGGAIGISDRICRGYGGMLPGNF